MRIVVNRELCEGNARCVQLAPDVFQVDDKDQMHLLIEEPGESRRDAVESAAALCPRQALSVQE